MAIITWDDPWPNFMLKRLYHTNIPTDNFFKYFHLYFLKKNIVIHLNPVLCLKMSFWCLSTRTNLIFLWKPLFKIKPSENTPNIALKEMNYFIQWRMWQLCNLLLSFILAVLQKHNRRPLYWSFVPSDQHIKGQKQDSWSFIWLHLY